MKIREIFAAALIPSVLLAVSAAPVAVPSALSAQSLMSEASVSCTGMRVTVCPKNDFEFVRDGCGAGGDYIEIWVRDWGGSGVPGIPPTDYWMGPCDASATFEVCFFTLEADSLTSGLSGFEGRTTVSGRIRGGGCALSGGVKIAVQGQTIVDPVTWEPVCLDIVIVSPDLNGDLVVDLSDLAEFGLSYNRAEGEPGYSGCCDFNDDGDCNLSDFAFLGQHYQHVCM